MTGPAIKICGISTAPALDAAIGAHVDHAGFVFYPPSPRNVTPAQAAELAARAAGRVSRVGLFVDADEVVSDELRDEIEAEFARDPGDVAGYRFPRMVHYLGKWIRHGEWYPDIKLRLFRKDRGHSEGQEPHDRVVVDGLVKTLRAPLYHFTYDNLADHIRT